MLTRLFLLYVVVELAALIALVSTIGFGWTVLVLVGTFAIGVALAGSQVARQFARLRSGVRGRPDALSDGALTALGALLVVIPGLVSSVAGVLLLIPATRGVAGPALATVAMGRLGRYASLVTVTSAGVRRYRAQRADVIDAEVLDVTETRPAQLPVDWAR